MPIIPDPDNPYIVELTGAELAEYLAVRFPDSVPPNESASNDFVPDLDVPEDVPPPHVCFVCESNIETDDEFWLEVRISRYGFESFVSSYPHSVRGQRTIHREVTFCSDCIVSCYSCDVVMEEGDVCTDNDGDSWCSDCYNDRYCHCSSCGDELMNDDANTGPWGDTYCDHCHEPEYEEDNGPIESYGHTTFRDHRFCFREWTVTGIVKHTRVPSKFPALGFELETNTSDYTKRVDAARFMLDGLPDDYLIIKEDGSVSGFEMVTLPADLRTHMEMFPWDKLPVLASKYAMTSWRGSNCGLHVHISKSSMSSSHLYKFMSFHDHNSWALTRFAGRTTDQWARFGKYDYDDRKSQAMGRTTTERYVAVNTQPRDTAELRYFRGSLRPDTVKATLEFVHALWLYTRDLSYADVRNGVLLTIDGFARFAREHSAEYPLLHQRFVDREVIAS